MTRSAIIKEQLYLAKECYVEKIFVFAIYKKNNKQNN